MKRTIEQGSGNVKAAMQADAFAVALAAVRAVYQEQIRAILAAYRPRIERGEFGDPAKPGEYQRIKRDSAAARCIPAAGVASCKEGDNLIEVDPPRLLLATALAAEVEALRSPEYAAAVLLASPFEWDCDGDDEELAADCVASDVLALYRSETRGTGRRARHTAPRVAEAEARS